MRLPGDEDYDYDEYDEWEMERADDDSPIPIRNALSPLSGPLARFVPGEDYHLHKAGCQKPSDASSFLHSHLHYCSSCHLTWVQGIWGPSLARMHVRHAAGFHPSEGELRSTLVRIDGACRDNGQPGARAGYGVYFGPRSKYNIWRPLQLPDETVTSQKAELHALLAALKTVRDDVVSDFSNCFNGDFAKGEYRFRLIVATDSSYVVESMCEHLPKWRRVDGTEHLINKSGKVIKNSKSFLKVQELLGQLAKTGVEVVYLHIPRRENSDADLLANLGIDAILPNRSAVNADEELPDGVRWAFSGFCIRST